MNKPTNREREIARKDCPKCWGGGCKHCYPLAQALADYRTELEEEFNKKLKDAYNEDAVDGMWKFIFG